ncbi:uridine kinase [Gemmiger formicilis]|uniref:uridine kinase n=1 Tax=Gemmiger formicilis TaxID=745368 RepID=UPI0019592045|nr:uridine kinase [Gemmiger formicilis]MBM6715480.1 uridine kinase [Gemmiger formicilis]
MKTTIIGIAGGTGSGKSTLTARLREHFGEHEVSVINHDSYYKRHDELPYEERCKLNYDHPDSFDTELLIEHLRALRRGETVQVPVYNYSIHNRSDKTVTVSPAPVIIVEGILIFDSAELCSMMDLKVFVDTDADVRILRRIVRDVKYRGRTLDSVVKQYLTTVKPMHEQFVEPSKRKADLIVPEGGRNEVALDMLIKWVSNHLQAE